MDDDVPQVRTTEAPPEASAPDPDLRLLADGGGGGVWTVEVPGTEEVTYQEVADPAPQPAWFDAPDTDA